VKIHQESWQQDLMSGAFIFESLNPIQTHRKHPLRNLDHRSFSWYRLLDRSIFSQDFKLSFGGFTNYKHADQEWDKERYSEQEPHDE
jgi:hypothetical protein